MEISISKMDYFSTIGTCSSIVGLIVTIYLLTIADKIKSAVKNAIKITKKNIFEENLVSDLRDVEKTLIDFDNEIRNKNLETLVFLVKKTCNKLSNIIAKYSNEIKGTSKVFWIKQELEGMLDDLTSKDAENFTKADESRYSQFINKKRDEITEELGYFENKIFQEY